MERFGKTLLLLLFIMIFAAGARMLIRVGDPVVRRFSPSLADSLQSV